MEGFSDGVFGFAATLLVLDIALRPPGTPLQQLLHAWPGYLAYLASLGLLLPVAAVALNFGLAVYLVVPFRETARVLARRHSTRQ